MPLGDLAAEARSVVLLGTPGHNGSLVKTTRAGLTGGNRWVKPVSPALPLVPARKRGRPPNPPGIPNTNKSADRQNRQTARYGTSTPAVRKDLVSRVRVESAEKGSKAWGKVAKQAGRDERRLKAWANPAKQKKDEKWQERYGGPRQIPFDPKAGKPRVAKVVKGVKPAWGRYLSKDKGIRVGKDGEKKQCNKDHFTELQMKAAEWARNEMLKGHELSADDLMDEYVTCLREALYDLQQEPAPLTAKQAEWAKRLEPGSRR